MVTLRYVRAPAPHMDPYRLPGHAPVVVGGVLEVDAPEAERICGDYPGCFESLAEGAPSPLASPRPGLEALPAKLRGLMEAAGLDASASDQDLLSVKGIGPAALGQIREVLSG